MKLNVRNYAVAYIDKAWAPALVAIIFLLAFAAAICAKSELFSKALFFTFTASLLGIVAVAVVCFARRRWKQGFIRLGYLLVTIILSAVVIGAVAFFSMFGPSDDGFADKLTIPKNISVTKPVASHYNPDSGQWTKPPSKDRFQCSLMQALQQHASNNSIIEANIPSLFSLHKNHPLLLNRYLASSPAWRVFEEHGQRFATRRWIVEPHWHYDLHGYYSNFDVSFQTRTTLGLTGNAWARGSQRLDPGQKCSLDLSKGNTLYESHCSIEQDGFVVELFEESSVQDRLLTKAALAYMEDEFHGLLVSPKWSTIEKAITPIMSPPAQPVLRLWDESQPGIYESEIWANPGEAGMIYLRAYEVTHNTRLSANRLKQYSNEWIGWSKNPKQLFLSNTQITIYEGDWGKPYAARFEVWFKPDSSKPERKLIQKVFKIEGWQR